MSSDTLICRDLHMRFTDTHGKAVVRCHRVWDADRFILARQLEASHDNAKVGAEDPTLPQRAKVEVITEAEYLKARKQ